MTQQDPTSPSDNRERARVLVVDDEQVALDTVRAILDGEFEVACRSSASEALSLLQEQRFDVVCTDYQMPERTGLDLISEIDRRQLLMGLVLVTGRYEAYSWDERNNRDATGSPLSLLLKPYEPEELLDAVRRASTFARMKRAVHALDGGGGGVE